MLKRLSLTNYRKFERADIEFGDGITGIIGSNGAGKSTIVEAIVWAIYGHPAARTNKELIKRQGAGQNEPCRVVLQFELDGDDYEVVREMRGKNLAATASVKVNSGVAVMPGANSALEATEFLSKKIGMDLQPFVTSIVAMQKELDAISNLGGAKRRELVLRMLRIDAIDEAIGKARSDKRDKRKELEIRGSYLQDTEEIKRKIGEVGEAIKAGDAELDRFKKDADDAKNEADAHFAAKNELQRVYELDSKLRERLAVERMRSAHLEQLEKEKRLAVKNALGAAAKTASLEEKLSNFKVLEAKKTNLESLREKSLRRSALEKEANRALAALEEIGREGEGISARLAVFRNLDSRLEAEAAGTKSAEEELAKLFETVSKAGFSLDSLVLERKSVEEKKRKLEELGSKGNCPTCLQPLGEHREMILADLARECERLAESGISASKELSELKKLRAEKEGALVSRKAALVELQANANERKHLTERVKTMDGRREKAKSELDAARVGLSEIGACAFDEGEYAGVKSGLDALKGVAEQFAVLKNEESKIDAARHELESVENDISAAKKSLEKITLELKTLGFDKQEYDLAMRRYESAIGLLGELGIKVAGASAKSEMLAREKDALEKKLSEQEEIRKAINSLRKEITLLERLAGDRDAGLLNDFKRHLISRIGPLLSRYASESFARLTDGRYSDIELDGDYNVHIYDDGERFELGRFSGGENDLANLCLRLAISQLMGERNNTDFQFIILDEIFGSQDPERKANVMRALSDLTGRFRQIILITHVEDVKDSFERVLTVKENADGTSSVVSD